MSRVIIDGDAQSLLDFHGHSVFTTLCSRRGELLLWPQHWARIVEHCRFFNYVLPKEQDVLQIIHREQKQIDHAKVRVIVYRTNFAVTCEPLLKPPSSIYDGVAITHSTMQVHPQLAAYKTGNSLPYAIASNEAQERGVFEALLADHQGFIVDGSRTSIMMFDGNTMTVFAGGLRGLMREHALSHVATRYPIATRYMRKEDMTHQLLLANSLIGVVPVGPIAYDFVHDLVELFRMDG